ncbi:M1 family metallopeptidase [Fimbriimonas ginsengisoli]|uniref:Aminopeptidase N n=1 Tax=Fimbriimonas ginsengisoli Gsoil 348 TaxID=661478 RepID=A0A068NT46_FIMGI|nr:M1 family metallopeptidase [Fimbriimonas ginsengisoli]AIE85945.1 peptidase M1 membrane alanine aminopeptidase [Fimbriimonas ginsengisoli Gsoil 348]
MPLFLPLLMGQAQNPFAPPVASMHYALDRTCDLTHLAINLDVDYPNRVFTGHAVNFLTPLRNGISEVRLMAGPVLQISRLTVDGQPAKYRREGRNLFISTPGLKKGKPFQIAIDYSAKNSRAQPFGGMGGFHWINTREGQPATRVGFWTQGETEFNSDWAPTWDYPNDLTTSEETCTVQADWNVIGNGTLVSNTVKGNRRTYHWKMTQPHATYLLTLVGGPLDIKRDKWQGVDLWYVVPRGEAKYIDDTFGHTKDMLTFFSDSLGVKYAWPKYAQNFMYDFGGGMENVSATTLGEGSITEARAGYFTADSLLSHEMAHQWFGDLVTCKDWGDTWLNESFASFMEAFYTEHSRNVGAYVAEMDDNMASYFAEARRYKRPLSTKMYPNGDAMFDSHTYPKGAVILHTLRRFLGDENFLAVLNLYLRTWRHTPVESAQLRRAMTEATGINVEPFWAQWIEKPGHPVLDYTWKQEGGKTLLTVKQTQNTADGTPVYDIPAKAGVISGGVMTRYPVHLSKVEETFELPVTGTVQAVVLDPDHDFLREIPNLHWSPAELPAILAASPSGSDRTTAMRRMLSDSPSDATVQAVVAAVRADNGPFPSIRTIAPLAGLERADLRPLFTELLGHPNFGRRAEAVLALGRLPQDQDTTRRLRELVNPQAPIQVVTNAIQVLAKWDAIGNADVFKKALLIPSRFDRIKRAAQNALDG